jgi:hypothetical protein
MRLRDMKYIGFKHQRENKQNTVAIMSHFRLLIYIPPAAMARIM